MPAPATTTSAVRSPWSSWKRVTSLVPTHSDGLASFRLPIVGDYPCPSTGNRGFP